MPLTSTNPNLKVVKKKAPIAYQPAPGPVAPTGGRPVTYAGTPGQGGPGQPSTPVPFQAPVPMPPAPALPPSAAPKTYLPILDFTKSGDPNKFDITDLFPNFQQKVLDPFGNAFKPEDTPEHSGQLATTGGVASALLKAKTPELPQALGVVGKLAGAVPESVMGAFGLPSMLTEHGLGVTGIGGAMPIPQFVKAINPLEYIQAFGTATGNIVRPALGLEQQTASGAAPVLPPFLRNALSSGLEAAAAAIQSLPQGKTSMVSAELDKTVADAVTGWMKQAASDLRAGYDQTATPGERENAVATLAANAIGTIKVLGVSPELAKPFEGVLKLLIPDEQRRAELLAEQEQYTTDAKTFHQTVTQNILTGKWDLAGKGLAAAWDASEWTYEGGEKVSEAFNRLVAGENFDQVFADIDASLTLRDRAKDILGQIVLDPTNLWGVIQAPKYLRDITVSKAARFLVAAPETEKLVEGGGKVERLIQTIPLLRRIGARPQTSLALHYGDEAIGLMGELSGAVKAAPDVGKRLVELGIDAHPLQVLNELLLNPDAKKIAGVAVDTEKVREALGLTARLAGPEEAKALRVAVGTPLDMLRSEVANNTRILFSKYGQADVLAGKVDNALKDSYKAMSNIYDMTKTLQDDVVKAMRGDEIVRAGKTLQGNEALEAVQDGMADILMEMDKVYRVAYGLPPATRNIPTQIMQGIQSAFSVVQLAPFNPGFVTRQYFSNNTALLADGIRAYGSHKDIYAKLADLEIAAPFLGWGAGQQSMGKATGLMQWARNTPIAKAAEVVENDARAAAFVSGYEKLFGNSWKIGQNIPAEAWNKAASALPASVANKLQGLVETARTQKQLNSMAGKLSGEAWRLVDNPELVNGLHEAGLLDEIANVLQTAGDKTEAMNRITELFDPDTARLVDMAAMQQPLKGTMEAELAQNIWRDFQETLKHLTPDQMAKAWDDYWRNIAIERVYLNRARSYTYQAIDGIKDVDVKNRALTELRDNFGELERHFMAEDIDRYVTTAGEMLNRRDLEALKSTYPDIFKDAHSIDEAKALFYGNKDSKWANHYVNYADQMMEWVQKTYGADPKLAPSIEAIEGVLPLAKKNKQILQDKLFKMMDANGFDGGRAHFFNWLKKNKFIDSNYFKWQDVQDTNWYNRVVDAMEQHGKAPTEWAEDISKVAADPIPARPMFSDMGQDILAGRIAQQTNEQKLVADALKWIEGKSDDVTKLTTEQIRAVNEFASGIAPRLTETRTIAQRVGQQFIEGTVFNYANRRNFDTALSFASNYPFWHLRNLASWARRMWYQPAAVATLVKIRKAINGLNRDKPEWWKDQITIEGIGGQTLFIPILGLIDPLNGFFGDKYRDPNKRSTWYGTILDEASQYGPGLHALYPMIMMASAFARNNPEEAVSWQNYVGQPSRGINALSALALGALGDKNPVPGGLILEPWLWQDKMLQGIGSPADAKRIYYTIGEMVKNGEITKEQAADLMINPTGPLWDQALQKSRENSAASVLMSWLLGAPLKPRPEFELEIQTMMTERAALSASKETMSQEEYRLAWADMRQKYPWMDYVVAASRNQDERQSSYAWSVFNRLPPNSSRYFQALGFSTEEVNVMSALMDKFYDKNVGLEKMNPLEREQFMNAMYQLGAVLALPDDATAKEWENARLSRNAMYATLNQKYPDVQTLEDAYFETLNTQGRDAANMFLEGHAMLENYWREKDQMVAADPTLSKYYASMEQYERVLWADWRNDMEKKYPGVTGMFDEYYSLKESDPEGAKKFFKEHPQMKAYYAERDVFTLSLRDQLGQFGDKIMALEPHFAEMRTDARITTPGQQSVSDLIASGSRPMGDFELPEDLPDRETNAKIGNLLESVPQGNMGAVIGELRRQGGLDGVLDAYYEFRNTGTIAANRKEIGALLTALENIFAEKGWKTLGADADFLAKALAKGGGGGSSKRLKSASRGSSHGGGGGGGKNSAAINARMEEQMAQVRDKAPLVWENLRRMATMSPAEIEPFLHETVNLWLLRYLDQAGMLGQLRQILAYFASLNIPPAPVKARTSGSRTPHFTTRYQIPGL